MSLCERELHHVASNLIDTKLSVARLKGEVEDLGLKRDGATKQLTRAERQPPDADESDGSSVSSGTIKPVASHWTTRRGQTDIIEPKSLLYDEPQTAAMVDRVINEVCNAENKAVEAAPAPTAPARAPQRYDDECDSTVARRQQSSSERCRPEFAPNNGHFFPMEPCPHDPDTLRMYVDTKGSGSLEQDRWQKSIGRTVWADLLCQPGKTGPGPFNDSNWQEWMIEVISRCSPLMPERLMKTFLWEAVKIPFEDCDNMLGH